MKLGDLARLISRDAITTTSTPQRSKGVFNKIVIIPSLPSWISINGIYAFCLGDSHNLKVKNGGSV